MHILQKNSKYSNFSVDVATKYPDGLAVLTVFLKAAPSLEEKCQETKQKGLNRILILLFHTNQRRRSIDAFLLGINGL